MKKSVGIIAGSLAALVLLSAGPSPAFAAEGPSGTASFAHHTANVKSSSTSGNWSGYAQSAGGYSSASATWTVPTVTTSSTNKYATTWVGIDGWSNSNLIQTGTEEDTVGGKAVYYAWWEILPAVQTRINLAVSPGNSITGTVAKVSGNTWSITLKNNTTGQSFTTNQNYTGPASDVEYIHEATQINGTIAPMAQTTPVTFTGLTENGTNPNLTADQKVSMVQNGVTVETPDNPSSGNSFTDRYTG
ncbi:G1 family glutamic endopeptidase [Arthrobacter sp. NPDC090010]|uniref:G1 family glutamic endopeptidase n=1 Tax=Arthrobacter sp. NPDC090010 TaxID=3363942 RepID=UPI00382E9279